VEVPDWEGSAPRSGLDSEWKKRKKRSEERRGKKVRGNLWFYEL
jgi:hypothetical protein